MRFVCVRVRVCVSVFVSLCVLFCSSTAFLPRDLCG